MFDGQPFRDDLVRRLDAIRLILDAAHPAAPPVGLPDAGREARGLSILLLFASYEHLLTSICRRLLEIAQSLGVGNRRLREGFRLFAVRNVIQAINGASEGKVWREVGHRLLECAFDSRNCTINPDLFPSDGSFMKRSQVAVFCELFQLGQPGPILREVWDRLDTVVSERNGIAHGRLTPDEVGRNYSLAEVRALVDLWQLRWTSFIDNIEARAAGRSFYRHDR